jgi:hypothetical protein
VKTILLAMAMLGPCLTVSQADAQNSAEAPLVAVSLKNAIRRYEKDPHTDAFRLMGYMTYPETILKDDSGDLILLGRREAGKAPLSFDDVIVSWKNLDNKTQDEGPSISIEPPKGRPNALSHEVKLKGHSLAGSHLGLVYFRADLRLKLFGLGFEKGVPGLPNEIELMQYEARKGNHLDPLVAAMASSYNEYFVPYASTVFSDKYVTLSGLQVRCETGGLSGFQIYLLKNHIPKNVVLRITMGTGAVLESPIAAIESEVRASLKKEIEVAKTASPKEIKAAKPLSPKEIERYTKRIVRVAEELQDSLHHGGVKAPIEELAKLSATDKKPYVADYYSASEAEALIGTLSFEKLEGSRSEWHEVKACFALQALLSTASHNLAYDKASIGDKLSSNEMQPQPVVIPASVPVATRAEGGITRVQDSGGIAQEQITSETLQSARQGGLDDLMEAALFQKPGTDAAYWVVPLDPSGTNHFPANATQASLDEYLDSTKPVEVVGFETNTELANGRWAHWQSATAPGKGYWSGWRPYTDKPVHFEISGNANFSLNQELDATRLNPRVLYPDPPQAPINLNYDVRLSATFRDKLEIGADLPFAAMLASEPMGFSSSPTSSFAQTRAWKRYPLPGASQVGLIGGMENATLDATLIVAPGRRNKPSLELSGNVTTPLHDFAFKGQLTGFPFGTNGWIYGPGVSSTVQEGSGALWRGKLQGFFENFRFDGSPEQYRGTTYVASIERLFPTGSPVSPYAGFAYTRYIRAGETALNVVEAEFFSSTRHTDWRQSFGFQVGDDGSGLSFFALQSIPLDRFWFGKNWWK